METCGFKYINGQLFCESVPVSDTATQFGTPVYIYSRSTLLNRLKDFRSAFAACNPLVCFSVKSLSNLSVLKLLADQGCGFDVVSGGELYRVLKAGGDPARTVFAGVGKTKEEILYALRRGIFMFNVESESELRLIESTARGYSLRAKIALRINPDVDAETHEKTTTGKKENKFGIAISDARRLAGITRKMEAVELRGIHIHLGSPIYDTSPYVRGLEKTGEFLTELSQNGIEIETVNIGGGFCMSYTGEQVPGPAEYAASICPRIKEMDVGLILEPGRHIAAPAGILLTKVLFCKETPEGKKFVIIDGGMNDLLRPSLYDAFHRIWPADCASAMPTVLSGDSAPEGVETERVDIAGPVCESGDCMAKERPIPPVKEGDLLAIFDAGAYGFTMSSNYNGRPRPAEVLVGQDSAVLVSRRENCYDLIAREELTATNPGGGMTMDEAPKQVHIEESNSS